MFLGLWSRCWFFFFESTCQPFFLMPFRSVQEREQKSLRPSLDVVQKLRAHLAALTALLPPELAASVMS